MTHDPRFVSAGSSPPYARWQCGHRSPRSGSASTAGDQRAGKTPVGIPGNAGERQAFWLAAASSLSFRSRSRLAILFMVIRPVREPSFKESLRNALAKPFGAGTKMGSVRENVMCASPAARVNDVSHIDSNTLRNPRQGLAGPAPSPRRLFARAAQAHPALQC